MLRFVRKTAGKIAVKTFSFAILYGKLKQGPKKELLIRTLLGC